MFLGAVDSAAVEIENGGFTQYENASNIFRPQYAGGISTAIATITAHFEFVSKK